jgi:hypothetical protein
MHIYVWRCALLTAPCAQSARDTAFIARGVPSVQCCTSLSHTDVEHARCSAQLGTHGSSSIQEKAGAKVATTNYGLGSELVQPPRGGSRAATRTNPFALYSAWAERLKVQSSYGAASAHLRRCPSHSTRISREYAGATAGADRSERCNFGGFDHDPGPSLVVGNVHRAQCSCLDK